MKHTNVYVFDLDRTVIDSDHRVAAAMDKDGNLNIAKYREGQTKENIMKDTLLPLAEVMKNLISSGEQVVICTARALTKSDYYYLKKHCLKVPMICSRDQLPRRFGNKVAGKIWNMKDAEYKYAWCEWLKRYYKGPTTFHMYDDHQGVLCKVRELGFRAFDAVTVNELLTQFLDMGYQLGFADGADCIEKAMSQVHNVIEFEDTHYYKIAQ